MPQLPWGKAAEGGQVLERGQFDLLNPETPRAGRPLILPGKLEALQQQTQAPARVRICS